MSFGFGYEVISDFDNGVLVGWRRSKIRLDWVKEKIGNELEVLSIDNFFN